MSSNNRAPIEKIEKKEEERENKFVDQMILPIIHSSV